ncbi:unnamed protein product [Echinostoma caproni]|uniref:Protein kintoun n=1 Tax=Echinostoma caproni TaxID=27848 RepID=A0A183AXJ3_9TREM|nr:unnamed protein product [Echinostoma caproni]
MMEWLNLFESSQAVLVDFIQIFIHTCAFYPQVYDVAFHPKAFELANTSAAMRRLLNVTAVEGLQRQFNLCLGKTVQQAFHLAQLIKSASEPLSRPLDPNSTEEPMPSTESTRNRTETVAREEAILRAVHTLKGTTYKGMARPAVIRRRRTDYEECQADLKRRMEEELQSCTDPIQRETIKKLSKVTGLDIAKTGPSKPAYTITYSSDFDMINCRDAPDVNPVRPPDRLRISVKLPGIVSSNAVDLELTATNLSLTSEKPVAYQLELKLPYEVDDSKGVAKFDKSTCTLVVTAPLMQKRDPSSTETNPPTVQPLITPISVETSSTGDDSHTSPGNSTTTCELQTRKKRRKRNRRRQSSASDTANEGDAAKPTIMGESADQKTEPVLVAPVVHHDQLESECSRLDEPSDTVPRSETIEESTETEHLVASTEPSFTIPITHVGLQQLTVCKDRLQWLVHILWMPVRRLP